MADDSKQPIHPLRQRMIEDMTLRGISLASQKNYLRAVRSCCTTMKKRPEDLSAEDVRSFLLHLQSLPYNCLRHFRVSTASGRAVHASLCVFAYEAMDFTVDTDQQPEETGAGITRPDGRVRLRILRGLNSMKLQPVA